MRKFKQLLLLVISITLVSCSPFRVPIARLAAAQAAIKNPRA